MERILAGLFWVWDKGAILGTKAAVLAWPFGGADKGLISFCRNDPEGCKIIGICFLGVGFLTVLFGITAPVSMTEDLGMALWLAMLLIGLGSALMRFGHLLKEWQWGGYRKDLILGLARQATKFRAGKIAALAEAEGEKVLAEAISQMPSRAARVLPKELLGRMIASRDRDVRIVAIKTIGNRRLSFYKG